MITKLKKPKHNNVNLNYLPNELWSVIGDFMEDNERKIIGMLYTYKSYDFICKVVDDNKLEEYLIQNIKNLNGNHCLFINFSQRVKSKYENCIFIRSCVPKVFKIWILDNNLRLFEIIKKILNTVFPHQTLCSSPTIIETIPINESTTNYMNLFWNNMRLQNSKYFKIAKVPFNAIYLLDRSITKILQEKRKAIPKEFINNFPKIRQQLAIATKKLYRKKLNAISLFPSFYHFEYGGIVNRGEDKNIKLPIDGECLSSIRDGSMEMLLIKINKNEYRLYQLYDPYGRSKPPLKYKEVLLAGIQFQIRINPSTNPTQEELNKIGNAERIIIDFFNNGNNDKPKADIYVPLTKSHISWKKSSIENHNHLTTIENIFIEQKKSSYILQAFINFPHIARRLKKIASTYCCKKLLRKHDLTKFYLGIFQAYAKTKTNEWYCWGNNSENRLGLGHEFRAHGNTYEPVSHSKLMELKITSVFPGIFVTFAKTDNKEWYCWGGGWDFDQYHGQFGLGDTKNDKINHSGFDKPTRHIYLTQLKITEIFPGYMRFFAKNNENMWYCWGKNDEGQLGLDHARFINKPSPHTALNKLKIIKVFPGYGYVFAKNANSEWYCWGQNDKGQLALGHNKITNKPTPHVQLNRLKITEIFPLNAANAIAAKTAKDKYYIWGNNSNHPALKGYQNNHIPTPMFHDRKGLINFIKKSYALKKNATLLQDKHDLMTLINKLESHYISNTYPSKLTTRFNYFQCKVNEFSENIEQQQNTIF